MRLDYQDRRYVKCSGSGTKVANMHVLAGNAGSVCVDKELGHNQWVHLWHSWVLIATRRGCGLEGLLLTHSWSRVVL